MMTPFQECDHHFAELQCSILLCAKISISMKAKIEMTPIPGPRVVCQSPLQNQRRYKSVFIFKTVWVEPSLSHGWIISGEWPHSKCADSFQVFRNYLVVFRPHNNLKGRMLFVLIPKRNPALAEIGGTFVCTAWFLMYMPIIWLAEYNWTDCLTCRFSFRCLWSVGSWWIYADLGEQHSTTDTCPRPSMWLYQYIQPVVWWVVLSKLHTTTTIVKTLSRKAANFNCRVSI